MANLVYIISICFLVTQVIHLVHSDISTIDRIKKHQEWLRQRNKSHSNPLPKTNLKSTFEPSNLWRNHKTKWGENDVYPEVETTSSSSSSSSSSTSTAATTAPTTTPTSTVTTTIAPITMSNTDSISTTTTVSSISLPLTTAAPILEVTTSLPKLSTTTTTKKSKPKARPYPRWANWSSWSECTRSCGGGLMSQTRKCISRVSSSGKRFSGNACVGAFKRYQVCNDFPCPGKNNGVLDMRLEQCAAYNDVDFQGSKYNWEPYIKDDAECELNCKPMGMKYFATLNDTVIDGTPCARPAEYYRFNYTSRAMCVDGICKAVHASGAINGLQANSGAVSCGGLLCKPVTGIFTRDPLPEDAYVHVATLPAGASNISITELKNSANLLVLRTSEEHYIFNGENSMSDSAMYEAAGATFDYHRIDGLQHSDGVTEWITSTGPIRESVELLIFSKTLNPGVKYEYLLPIVSDSEENELSLESSDGFLKAGNEDNASQSTSSSSSSRTGRRRRFNWKVVGFSPCSKSCGGGIQSPVIRCARENPVRYYSQRRCMHSEKPVLNENLLRCNTQPCPAYWRADEWGECRCHSSESFRSRELSCVQELASGLVIHVDRAACLEEAPPTQKQCECPRSRRPKHSRQRAVANSTRQRPEKSGRSMSGSSAAWLMSEWNQHCSVDCGSGVEYRTIFCDRSKSNSERCDPSDLPETTRPCTQHHTCEMGEWFAGPWTPCNGNCFNLTRSRTVLCIHNQLITDEDQCKAELRPQISEKCSHEEVEYCAPRWHYSEWSECTKTCDGGNQRRSVKCLEYDEKQNSLRESSKCRYALREPIFRSCNTHECESNKYELPLNDEATATCTDRFDNCKWVVEAKLCGYDYYSENCCVSCKSRQ